MALLNSACDAVWPRVGSYTLPLLDVTTNRQTLWPINRSPPRTTAVDRQPHLHARPLPSWPIAAPTYTADAASHAQPAQPHLHDRCHPQLSSRSHPTCTVDCRISRNRHHPTHPPNRNLSHDKRRPLVAKTVPADLCVAHGCAPAHMAIFLIFLKNYHKFTHI